MQVSKRTMNWLPRNSMWEEAQIRNARRKERAEAFISQTSSLASTFGSVQANLNAGMAQLTTQIAVERINARVNVKV